MAMRRILLPWESQPQEPCEVDRSNSLASQLRLAAYPSGGLFDARSQKLYAPGGAAVLVPSSQGMALAFNGTSGIQIAQASDAEWDLSGECTMFVLCAPTSAAGGTYGQYPLASGDASASASQGALRVKGVAGCYWGGSPILDGVTALQDGKFALIGFVRSGSTGAWAASIYVNGVLDATTATSVNPSSQQVLALAAFGAFSGLGLPFDGKIAGAWVWKRALSRAEAFNFYQSVWQLLAPRSLWSSAGSGAASFALTLTAGCAASSAVARATASSKAAAATAAGSRQALARKTVASSTTVLAAISSIKARLMTLAASVTISPVFGKGARSIFLGDSVVAGGIQKTPALVRITVSGVSALVGLLKAKLLTLSASVTASGSVRRAVSATRAAQASTGATVSKAVAFIKGASAALAGSLSKRAIISKAAQVSASAAAHFSKVKVLVLTAMVSVQSGLGKMISKTLAATTSILAFLARLFIGGKGPNDKTYPLAGKQQARPLDGRSQALPLAGKDQAYPLEGEQ